MLQGPQQREIAMVDAAGTPEAKDYIEVVRRAGGVKVLLMSDRAAQDAVGVGTVAAFVRIEPGFHLSPAIFFGRPLLLSASYDPSRTAEWTFLQAMLNTSAAEVPLGSLDRSAAAALRVHPHVAARPGTDALLRRGRDHRGVARDDGSLPGDHVGAVCAGEYATGSNARPGRHSLHEPLDAARRAGAKHDSPKSSFEYLLSDRHHLGPARALGGVRDRVRAGTGGGNAIALARGAILTNADSRRVPVLHVLWRVWAWCACCSGRTFRIRRAAREPGRADDGASCASRSVRWA